MTLQIIDQVHIDTNSAISLLTEHGLLVRTENYRQHFFYHVEYNSKLVQSETLFFCKGAAFKEDYLNEAIDRGATAYVAEQSYQNGATALIVTNIQRAMALLSNAFYGFPSNDLFAIGITGTKGKTSTAYFAATALNLGTDDRTALISTLNTSLGKGDVFKSKLTTPESLDLFRYLRQAVDNGMTHLVMEVSSQSYLLDRVYSLHFGIGVFLNISSDHVGQNEHPDFANYLFCKEQLLLNSSVCVLNTQMDHFEEVYQAAKVSTAPDKIYLFGEAGSHPDLDLAYQIQSTGLAGSNFQLTGVSDRGSALMLDGEYQSSVAGDYNVGNATAAAICAAIGGVKKKTIQEAFGQVHIAGRMEVIRTQEHGTVYVDYAHDYASVKRLLAFLKGQQHQGEPSQITVVLGAPGNKGVSRRPDLGKALAEERVNRVILTTDDPAFEDPQAIAAEIDVHIDHDRVGQVEYVADRREAIETAIQAARAGDLVVLAGKGTDQYQKVAGVDTPYPGDIAVARQVVAHLEG